MVHPRRRTARVEYHSTDGITWTYQRVVHDQVAVSATPNIGGVTEFDYDAATDTWVSTTQISASQIALKYRVGSGEWTLVSGLPALVTANTGATILNINGLWLVSARLGAISGQTYAILTSVDGINWTPRAAGGANATTGMVYANGRLITTSETGTTGSHNVRSSIDAGRTWTSLTTATHGSGAGSTATWSQMLAYYAGNLIWISPNNGSYIRRSTDDSSTMPGTVALNTIGALYAVFARQS